MQRKFTFLKIVVDIGGARHHVQERADPPL